MSYILAFVNLIILYLIYMFIGYIENRKAVIRWLLFLPVSSLGAFLCGTFIYLTLINNFPRIDSFLTSIVIFTICPIVFLYCVHKIIPRLNKTIVNILGVLWAFGSIYEIVIKSDYLIARIIQIIAIIAFLLYINGEIFTKKSNNGVQVESYNNTNSDGS